MRVVAYEIGFFLSAVTAAGALHELLAWGARPIAPAIPDDIADRTGGLALQATDSRTQ
jgi:hypothetical protein